MIYLLVLESGRCNDNGSEEIYILSLISGESHALVNMGHKNEFPFLNDVVCFKLILKTDSTHDEVDISVVLGTLLRFKKSPTRRHLNPL
jgi:hypothetical protein